MKEIECSTVESEKKKMTRTQIPIFVMTYGCFIMWSIKRGIESTLGSQEVESLIVGMKNHFAKYDWYDPRSFERIWISIEQIMPTSFKPKGQPGTIYPLADMVIAANKAGFSLDPPFDYAFGIHVMVTGERLANFGRQVANEHCSLR